MNIKKEESRMQVAKWGNSLAIRLPASVVRALELREGDDIEILIAAERHGLSVYDAMIVAAALLGGCKTLYSEDMQDGFLIDR
jgi:predicted nucleic acid-binding protein